MSRLALLGGPKAVTAENPDVFRWPIVNKAMEDGVLAVLRTGAMSGIDLSQKFEEAFARWHTVKYGLACSTGTAALHCAFFGAGVGTGDEVVCPSLTYWASALPCTAALRSHSAAVRSLCSTP